MPAPRMDDETKARVGAWATACLAYWKQFPPGTRITEAMVEDQPRPPDDIVFDAAAALTHTLACIVHHARTGEMTLNPSAESLLITSELIDRGVEAGLANIDPDIRFRRLRDDIDAIKRGEHP